MSFLLDFVRTLNTDELAKLPALALKGREEEVLDKMVQYRFVKDDADQRIQHELKLSKSHFDKINSVLLRKCYDFFTDGKSEKVFALLLEKQLVDLLYHEVKIREKNVLKKGDKKELKDFYWQAFISLRKVAVTRINLELLKKYALQYFKYFPAATTEDEGEIWLMYTHTMVFYFSVTGQAAKYEPVFWKTVHDWEKKLKGKKYHRANFHLYITLANYYDFYTSDGPKLIESLENALKEFEAANGKIQKAFKVYAYTKLAKAYCQNSNFNKALNIYNEAFEMWGDDLRRNAYHPVMYAVIAIICHSFDEAQKMMDENLKSILIHKTDMGMYFNVARNYAILHMQKDEYEEALDYLHMCLQVTRTETDLLGDILNRMVHNAYFILIGDLDTAASLLKKNRKFLGNKPKSPMTIEYGEYFNLLAAVIKYKSGKGSLPENFNEIMGGYNHGIAKLYGDLINKMLEKK